MAIEEKLLKSLEYLRNTDYNSGDVFQRNKEKIQNCVYVVDTLTSNTTKVLPNFQHLLSSTFETLFLICNDNESDLRLIAEESLNKIIKATDSENVNRVLMELHKELKKNGPVRSLRAALLRFANMAHLIRLPKRKQYLISIMPCIVSISERNDDIIHEALMKCLPKILKSLGNFLSETDVKTLLNTFLSNIGNSSPIIRRANANCLLAVCLNCRKPYQLLSHLLDTLLGNPHLVTASGENQVTVFTVLGVLSCLKLHLPYMKKMENIQEIQGSFGITKKTNVMQVGDDKFIQVSVSYLNLSEYDIVSLPPVYQMCLHFLLCRDDSVMSAALDTLNTLLQSCTPEIKAILVASDGIKSRRLLFPSRLLMKAATSQSIESRSSSTDNFQRTFTTSNRSHLDGILRVGDDVTAESCGQANDVDVGSFDDRDVSLLYCARLVCKSCILLGRPDTLIPDAVVRISVKNLALACLSSLFSIYPSSFLFNLDKNDASSSLLGQPISDITLLADHSDPQLRGAVRYAVASYLRSALAESNGRYEEWCANMLADRLAHSDAFALKNMIAFIKEASIQMIYIHT
ncbi:huntington disease protein [Holotrichia oblita]|uniref:Huntington disease protein n=1 Tax=Holotrichia oblita TaxID=644536 RepID=A0ACB9T0P9_HOLOL|nr:huntington disease protein [Holotrichia oblita]